MSKSIKVQIGAKQYALQGEDLELVEKAAALVDANIKTVIGDEPLETNDSNTLLLAALNIAELYIQNSELHQSSINLFTETINKANIRLEQALEQSNELINKN